MLRCFFHSFSSFFGRKPPCFEILVVSSGNVCDVHVTSSVLDISFVRISSVSHAVSHYEGERWGLVDSRMVRFSIMMEFFSKNVVWNFSIFSVGMGFSIFI